MATKSSLRAQARGRRRERRRGTNPSVSTILSSRPIPTYDLAEAEGLARQVATLARSMGGVALPALFASTPFEPDMSLVLDLFPRALLPVLVDRAGAPLGKPGWGLWEEGHKLVTRGHRPAQPDGPALPPEAIRDADLIIIPALAASPLGERLGQGGGWYDRALAHRSPSAPIVAIVFDDEVAQPGTIPVEPHDVPIDAIITPTRTIHASPR